MPLYIGRAGRTPEVPLDCVQAPKLDGRVLSLEGAIYAAQAGEGPPTPAQLALAIQERNRLNAYNANFDESVVPIIWTLDERLSGFYRVQSVSIDSAPSGLKWGIFPFSLSAEQVIGHASPQFEAIISGASIANPHSLTGVSWFSFPEAVTEQFYSDLCSSNVLRVADSGTLNFTDCNINYSGSLRYYLRPEDFYIGGAWIQVGDPLEVVVGRQIPDSPSKWRIDNGLVRVEPSTTSGRFYVSHFNGATWGTPKEYTVAGTEPANPPASPKQAGEITSFATMNVLRNSPETVSIRLSCVTEFGITFGRLFIDITLRRGDRNAVFILTTDTADQWKVRRTSAEAATAIPGGIRATSNDADGNRYVIGTSSDFTPNLTQGQITQNLPLRQFYFGIGSEVGGSSATGSATATELIKQLMAGQSERLVVASR